MEANGANLGCLCTNNNVTAVGALPDYNAALLEHFTLGYVLASLAKVAYISVHS